MDLRNEYLEADETTKRFLEQRYGKRVIQKALEEMESKEWLEKNSKSCPCCGTHIEVSEEGKAGNHGTENNPQRGSSGCVGVSRERKSLGNTKRIFQFCVTWKRR